MGGVEGRVVIKILYTKILKELRRIKKSSPQRQVCNRSTKLDLP